MLVVDKISSKSKAGDRPDSSNPTGVGLRERDTAVSRGVIPKMTKAKKEFLQVARFMQYRGLAWPTGDRTNRGEVNAVRASRLLRKVSCVARGWHACSGMAHGKEVIDRTAL